MNTILICARKLGRRFLLFALIAILAGCGSGSKTTPPPPTNSAEFAFAVNIATGASDIFGSKVDPTTGVLTAVGSGFGGVTDPTSLAVEPSNKFAYVSNFSDNTISAFAINASSGALTAVAGSPFPAAGNPVMIASESSGRYIYTANQSTADVSGFAIN